MASWCTKENLYIHASVLVPGDSGRLATFVYVVTVETFRPVGTRHFMFVITTETPETGQAKHAHLRSYRENLATRAGKAYSFTKSPRTPKECVCMFIILS